MTLLAFCVTSESALLLQHLGKVEMYSCSYQESKLWPSVGKFGYSTTTIWNSREQGHQTRLVSCPITVEFYDRLSTWNILLTKVSEMAVLTCQLMVWSQVGQYSQEIHFDKWNQRLWWIPHSLQSLLGNKNATASAIQNLTETWYSSGTKSKNKSRQTNIRQRRRLLITEWSFMRMNLMKWMLMMLNSFIGEILL